MFFLWMLQIFLVLTWMLSTLTQLVPVLCSLCLARAGKSEVITAVIDTGVCWKSMATLRRSVPSNQMTKAPLPRMIISRLWCPWVRYMQCNLPVMPTETFPRKIIMTMPCTCHQTMAQDHHTITIAWFWATKPILLKQATIKRPGKGQVTINLRQLLSPSTPTKQFRNFTTQTLRWVHSRRYLPWMLQIHKSKRKSLTPNILCQPQQDSTQPSLSKTEWIDQNNEAPFNSTEDHYKVSTKATPLADEECNNNTKDKNLCTAAGEDDVRDD